MTATVILSFDCEGKWGVADHLTREHQSTLSDASLKEAYRSVVGVLDEFAISATFAFVGCFVRQFSDLDRLRLLDIAEHLPYLRAAAGRIQERDQGWSAPWAIDMVSVAHEIALHGVTHSPWSQLVSSGTP